MAAEVSSDVNFIQDEDVLRRMWQQTEDFSRKKEIRARMYKLREQRLKDFYSTGELLSDTMSSRKYAGTTHADSIGDQGFLTMKTKEIRDSESPTREIHRRDDDNNYWNTVQQTTYSTSGEGDSISQSYEKTTAQHDVSNDGNIQTQIAAHEKGFQSSSLQEDANSKSMLDQSSRSGHVVSSSHGKSDNGDFESFTSSNQEESKSSFKTSQVTNTSNVSSSQWAESSSSANSTRRVISSSNYTFDGNNDETSANNLKSITVGDNDLTINRSDNDSRNIFQQKSSSEDLYNTAKTYHVTSSKNISSSLDEKNINSTKMEINTSSDVLNKRRDMVYNSDDSTARTDNIPEETYIIQKKSDSRNDDKTTYKTELTSDVLDYSTIDKQPQPSTTKETLYKEFKKTDADSTNVVVDQKIMSELQKLDSFLSTQHTTGTSTPVSPHSVAGDAANWTVVSSTNGEFVYSGDKKQPTDDTASVQKSITKLRTTEQPSSLDLPKDCTSGQYVTTYQQSYNNKRISVDNSPTHEAFARSLRQSPPSTPRSTTPRSLSKGSLDRSSPERKFKGSPLPSPDKERRGSVGSYTIEKPKEIKRKISETVKHGTSETKDMTVKTKRKLSSTQTKATSKTRASTPGTSPVTSPTRKQRGRSTSPSSENDSDASQVTYDKVSSSNSKKVEISKKKLVDSFNDTNIQKSLESTEDITVISPKKRSPERKVSDINTNKTSGILRKDSRTDSKKSFTTSITTTDIENSQNVSQTVSTISKIDHSDKSPEHSTEISVAEEIVDYKTPEKEPRDNLHSTPEPSTFVPIKCFRTSPEFEHASVDLILREQDHTSITEKTIGVSESTELREPVKPQQPITTRKEVTSPVLCSQKTDTTNVLPSPPKKELSPSKRPQSPVKNYSSPISPPKNISQVRRSPSPEKVDTYIKRHSSPGATDKGAPVRKDKSPIHTKEDVILKESPFTERSVSPKQRSPSPQKETIIKKTTSYDKDDSIKNMHDSSKNDDQPIKPTRSRSTSPSKQTTHNRPSAPTKIKSPIRRTSSPQKEVFTGRRTTSPEKDTPLRKETSPIRKTITSEKDKIVPKDRRSSSISPCSSPERNIEIVHITTERKINLPSTEKLGEVTKSQTLRTTRRSSIPRSEQTSVTKKTVETKTDVRSKMIERHTRPIKTPQILRKLTGPQSSPDRHILTTTNTYRTSVHQTVDKPIESVRRVPSKTVKSTRVFTIQHPTSTVKKQTPSTITKLTVTPKRTITKITDKSPIKSSPLKTVKTHTTTINRHSQQIKSKPTQSVPTTRSTIEFEFPSQHDDSPSDRSSAVSSPETVRPLQSKNIYPNDLEESDIYIDELRDDLTKNIKNTTIELSVVSENVRLENNVKNESINSEIFEENIENEKPPEYFPDEDYDEKCKITKESRIEVSVQDRKKVNQANSVKPKAHKSSLYTVTVRKPAGQAPKLTSTTPAARKSGPHNSHPSPAKKPSTIQTKKPSPILHKIDSINVTRITNDKNVVQSKSPKKQISKPEFSPSPIQTDTRTKQKKFISKVSHSKRVAETGIATRNASAAHKLTTITKKKSTKTKPDIPSSTSEDDEEDITTVDTENVEEKTYIEELEELRRKEELDYASKVTSTSDQENCLLSVIVQHPKSSRESSPEYTVVDQPLCTVSDDGGSHPRYADIVSEPEDVDSFDTQETIDKCNMAKKFISKERLYEKITDLDEDSEVEDVKLNVSVADRVSQFLEQSKVDNNTTLREEVTISAPTESNKSVLKAKTMFENIAKNQITPPAPNNKPVDILSRPSIFEARRGEVAPKKINSDTFSSPKTSSEILQSINSVQEEVIAKAITEDIAFINDNIKSAPVEDDYRPQVRESHDDTLEFHERRKQLSEERNDSSQTIEILEKQEAPVSKKILPNKASIGPEHDTTVKKQLSEKKKIFTTEENFHKTRPVERGGVLHTGEISSKKAFFERKAQVSSETTTRDNITLKNEAGKVKTSPRRTSGELPTNKKYQTTPFTDNERRVIPSSPERKVPASPDKEKVNLQCIKTNKERSTAFIHEEINFADSTTLNETDSLRKVSTEEKHFEGRKSIRQSPERKDLTTQHKPERKGQSPDRPTRKSPERKEPAAPTKSNTYRVSRQSPERTEPSAPHTHKPSNERPNRESPERKGPTFQKSSIYKPNRESPERKEPAVPYKQSPSRKSPERKEPATLVKPSTDRSSRESPERIEQAASKKPSVSRPNRVSPERKEPRASQKPSTDRPSRESPERKEPGVFQKPSTDRPSRESPERKEPRATGKSSYDRPSRESPERKEPRASQKPSIDRPSRESPERKEPIAIQKSTIDRPSRKSPERKEPRTPRKPSIDRPSRESPERKEPRATQKSSIDRPSRESPERTVLVGVKKPSTDRPSRESPERKKSVTSTTDERNQELNEINVNKRRTSVKRDSPDRYPPKKDDKKEPVELNRAGKFGVTLRRTSSTGSAGTQRRPSVQGDSTAEIEDIYELELLEQMMEKAVGYEQRRRIRAQIRIVKRDLEEKRSTATKIETSKTSTMSSGVTPLTRSGTKSPTCSPTRDAKTTGKTAVEQPADSKRPTEQKQSISPSRRPSSPTKPIQEPRDHSPKKQTRDTRKISDTKADLETSYESSLKQEMTTNKSFSQTSPHQKPTTNSYHRAEHETTSITTVRTQKRVEASREVSGTDSITSSYGVGPTDENGLPLFGLKALRRSNTIKMITNEIEQSEVSKPSKPEPEVCDAKGRPLFGLKALKTGVESEIMPDQKTTQQLKELVERHEKNARAPESQPRQKPRAKLRDSFILQQEDGHVSNVLEEFNSEQRGLSLRSIIQKHEGLANTSGNTRHEIDSSTTVVSSKSTVDSDGSVSISRDVLQGEMSSKNGGEPVGKIVQTQFSYHSPKTEDKHKVINNTGKITTTTTLIGGRRSSGPKITEVENQEDDHPRKISATIRKMSGPSVTEYDDEEEEDTQKTKNTVISSHKKRVIDDEEIQSKMTKRSFQKYDDTDEDDEILQRRSSTGKFVSSAVRRFSGSKTTDTENDDEETLQNTSTSKFSMTSHKQQTVENSETKSKTPSSVRRQIFKDEHETNGEEKKKTLVRGDSVRALQHKFQQATATKQSSAVNKTVRSRQSPEKDLSHSPGKVSQTNRSQVTESLSTSKVISGGMSVDKSEKSIVTTTTKKPTSFLDNTSCVTGVQDVLTRMKNADLVAESGDTDEDIEARALLNKFLGASVILQGMEQGMKTDSGHAATPGSAALVSKVEKQRIATTSRKQEEDIENIWDEKQLRILLEACSDYDGRRKIRQRLRTVMAEHKACADVVADTGEDVANSTVSQECFESKHVSTKREGSTVIHTEAHTRTASSSSRLTKANSVTSPFAKFKQLERQNSAPSSGSTAPLFKFTDPKLVRSASTVKERLLNWVQAQTKEYKNIQISNFSTSWSNGLAFCALIHHFYPDAFDYDKLTPDQRRHNFELAFRVAEEEAGIAPLLDVEDMVVMRRPDWKCVFTYVQSVYRRFHTSPVAVRC